MLEISGRGFIPLQSEHLDNLCFTFSKRGLGGLLNASILNG